jgi:hypothetical protein
MRAATLRMRSIPAIDVPPNFITMRAMAGVAPPIHEERA